jgi:hypothetical protein
MHKLAGHHDGMYGFLCLAFSPTGDMIAAGGNDGANKGYVRIWSLTRRGFFHHLPHEDLPRAIAFSPAGRHMAVGSHEGVHVWETATGKECRRIPRKGRAIWAVAFSPDGRCIAAADDRIVTIWDTTTDKPHQLLPGHRHWVCALAFSPDGRTLASSSEDTSVLLWKVNPLDRNARRAEWTASELEKRWDDLRGADATRAYTAMGAFASAPQQSVAFVSKQIPSPKPEPEPGHVERLIADLDNNDFTTRSKAETALEELGEPVEARIRKELSGRLGSLEQRRRLERVLEKITVLSPENLRWIRAIDTLEMLGTDEAKSALQTLHKQALPGRVRREAEASLTRLR